MDMLQVRVAARQQESLGIVSFVLEAVDGKALPAFTPGAHIDVHMRENLTRQYSLYSSPGDTSAYRIAVLREQESRGGSHAMHDLVREGDVLTISAPRNLFPLAEASATLLFAGGIGITPILCMAEHLHAEGQDFQLHYSARSGEHAAFGQRIRDAGYALRAHLHFGDKAGKEEIAQALKNASPHTHLYVCGPAGYIDYIVESAKSAGWSSDRIHLEHFKVEQDQSGESFDIRLAKSGKTFCVPEGKTVLNVLHENGFDIPMSCEQGICGTCLTGVLEGTPDHRDMYLTDEEKVANNQFLPCCSRAKTNVLVLDI